MREGSRNAEQHKTLGWTQDKPAKVRPAEAQESYARCRERGRVREPESVQINAEEVPVVNGVTLGL